MCPALEVESTELRRKCPLADVPFETTADAPGLHGVVLGQERAVEALGFGIGMRRHGYNVFAVGPPGIGKETLLRQLLDKQAQREHESTDWIYVHNFDDPERPRALELPGGQGAVLARAMDAAIGELRVAMAAAFDSDEYRTRKQQIDQSFESRREEALSEIREAALKKGVAVVQTGTGMALAPVKDDKPLDPKAFSELPEEEQQTYRDEIERVGEGVEVLLRKFHEWAHEHHDEILSLRKEMAAGAVHRVLGSVRESHSDLAEVLEHLTRVEQDIVDNADALLEPSSGGVEAAIHRALEQDEPDGPTFRRYRFNVVVDRTNELGAPVVYEENPSFPNLVGRVQHETRFGSLVANFTLIRAGAFHRALGGYLILDARKVLLQPYAWDALKRTIRSGEIHIESLSQALGLVPTVSLEPAPIPFESTKVVLTGDRLLYYMLSSLDPDFPELFKVLADFEESIDRSSETHGTYSNLIATLVSKEGLRPFDRGAVARVIDQAARDADDAEKLSVHMRGIVDLLEEADYWAGERERDLVTMEDVERAVQSQLRRSGRVQDRLQEAVRRENILIATSGSTVGQVNGLAVFQLGERRFGNPTRITARVRLGKGDVLDIEREVNLGGPIHSKGVLILTGFLGARYAADLPLSLSATLVFEQSYGQIDGDSASVAELCALLSAIAEVPIDQSWAVTGSVNQHGEVQPIGGVNEKIEGFFDVCRERGLTGRQGVLIPKANVKNLMLRQDVVDAAAAGQFHVRAMEHVDDALECLLGGPVGAPDESGRFEEDSVNGRIQKRLQILAERRRALAKGPRTTTDDD